MDLIKVAAASLNQTPLDWDNNTNHIIEAIKQATDQDVKLLCLPELCISGYGCEDAFHAPDTMKRCIESLWSIVPYCGKIAVAVGLPMRIENQVFDVACLIVGHRILGFVPKQRLAGEGIHYEPRWFKPWPANVWTTIDIGKQHQYPIGDVLFNIGGLRVGFEICEEAWVSDRTGKNLAARGANIILNPSASHFAFGKHEVRKRLVEEGSRAFNVTYIYANLVGNEAGRIIYDGDTFIATRGNIVSTGKRFTYKDVNLCTATIDIEATIVDRAKVFSEQPTIQPPRIIVDPDTKLTCSEGVPTPPALPLPLPTYDKYSEFTKAATLGLFDYMRKCKANGFIVSLSGGADSSATSILIHDMLHLATEELTEKELRTKLEHMPYLEYSSFRLMIEKLLTCVYQSTCNSGETTYEAAKKLSTDLGAKFYLFDVESVRKIYVGMVGTIIGTELTWEEHDMALQNVQARVRSPGVWLLANITNALLLTTSNRSEAAVGYATMDGDTSGGLCPIGGVDKDFLLKWLLWRQETAKYGGYKELNLDYILKQAPTAELRPQACHQTDEADLMPYSVLNQIEKLAIRDKKSPIEVYTLLASDLRTKFQGKNLKHWLAKTKGWVDKFYTLWCRNQWKRERYAPSFHVDDENLDPKTWCRFPILNGGYKKELQELRKCK